MLNTNPSNASGDHPVLKGTARVTPTISKPVYSLVTSFPSTTCQQSRSTATLSTSTSSTPTTQSTDLITLVSNIVSSSNLSVDKSATLVSTATVPITSTRSHIEEVIDDVAKGGLTTTTTPSTTTPTRTPTPPPPSTTTTTVPITTIITSEPVTSTVDTNPVSSSVSSSTGTTKSTSIPHILRDVMKTPSLPPPTNPVTSAMKTTTAVTSETLNLFDTHHRATSPLKTTAATTTTLTTSVSTTVPSSTPIVPVVVRPTASKTPTNPKRSSTPKADSLPSVASTMLQPFAHMLTSDSSVFAAVAAAQQNFSFPFFTPLSNANHSTGNASSNLLTSSLMPGTSLLATRTSSTTNTNSTSSGHVMTNPFLNTIMSGQQPTSLTNTNHAHEQASRRYGCNVINRTRSRCLRHVFLLIVLL
jgi:hypothetical protein